MHISPGPTPAAHSASPGTAAEAGSGETDEARNWEAGLQEQQTGEERPQGLVTAGQSPVRGCAG